jgi:release factor glutamine methyltransferase
LPGVFRPRSDSRLLARVAAAGVSESTRVLELCAGSGIVSVACALRGAKVTAVDVSHRAVVNTALNARLNGVSVKAVRGDLDGPVAEERFDLIVSNPPYVPAATERLPTRGPERAWAAGRDGRALIDRICRVAPAHLDAGGRVLLVHSSLCGTDLTLAALGRAGLEGEIAASERGPLGPLMAAQAERLGGASEEHVVVVDGRRIS